MRFLSLFSALFLLTVAASATPENIHPKLKPYALYIDKTWTAETEGFKDIQHWRWVNGGQAFLIEHSVNNGAYSGTSLAYYDEEKKQVVYRYATSAGFFTDGVLNSTHRGWTADEVVHGKSNGVDKITSGAVFDGEKMIVWSQMHKDGAWGSKEELTYISSPLPENMAR